MTVGAFDTIAQLFSSNKEDAEEKQKQELAAAQSPDQRILAPDVPSISEAMIAGGEVAQQDQARAALAAQQIAQLPPATSQNTVTVSERNRVDPRFSQATERLSKAQVAQAVKENKIQQRLAEREVKTLEKAGREKQRMDAAFDRGIEEAEAARAKEIEHIRAAMQDLEGPGGKVDPNRFWNSRTGAQKAASFGAAIMEGIAETLSEGRVKGIGSKLMERRIDQDIRNQELALANKKQGVRGRMNFLGALSSKVGDLQRAKQIQRGLMMEQTAEQLKLEQAKAKTPQLQARLGTVAAELEQKAAAAVREDRTVRTQRTVVKQTRPPSLKAMLPAKSLASKERVPDKIKQDFADKLGLQRDLVQVAREYNALPKSERFWLMGSLIGAKASPRAKALKTRAAALSTSINRNIFGERGAGSDRDTARGLGLMNAEGDFVFTDKEAFNKSMQGLMNLSLSRTQSVIEEFSDVYNTNPQRIRFGKLAKQVNGLNKQFFQKKK